MVLDEDEDLSFASMFNSMRLEEADEPSQAAKPRNIRTAMSDLDPVITYGSFGQVHSACTYRMRLPLHPALQAQSLCIYTICTASGCALIVLCCMCGRIACHLRIRQHMRHLTALHPLALLVHLLAIMACHTPQHMTFKAAALPQSRVAATPLLAQKH